MIAFKQLGFLFVVAFVAQTAHSAATIDSEDDLIAALASDFVEEVQTGLTIQPQPIKPLSERVEIIKTNFGDSENLNADVLSAILDTFKDKALAEAGAAPKFNMGKAIDKTKAELKEGFRKLGKFVGKIWDEVKVILKKCWKDLAQDMKKIPDELAVKVKTCASKEIQDGLTRMGEVVDINGLPVSTDEALKKYQECSEKKDARELAECFSKTFNKIVDALKAKAPTKEGEDQDQSKTIFEETMINVMRCVNTKDAMEHSATIILDSGTKCVITSVNERLNELNKTTETPAPEASAPEAA